VTRHPPPVRLAIPTQLAPPADPEAFADLLCEDPMRARALFAALTSDQREGLAAAHAVWLNQHGFPADREAVLAAWDAPIVWLPIAD
jgi:hypothetical protein